MPLLVRIVDPRGVIWDVTDRLLGDGVGEITESTEEDFLQLSHGDVDLSFDNADGAYDRYFRHVAPDDVYELLLDRKAVAGARTRWQRLFGGVLDLPWSLRFDRFEKTCSLQVFSYSKLLEKFSAEGIRRSVTGLTGSVTAATKVVTISDTSQLSADDKIRLRDNVNDETRTITRVLTATTVQTRDAWTNGFAAGTPLSVETPYHRDKGLQFLADAVLSAAGLVSRTISILSSLASRPVATPTNTTSYPRDIDTGIVVDPRSFTVLAGLIDARVTDDGTDRRAESSGPTSAWTVATTGALRTINDWTPYYDAQPANLPDNGSFVLDDGQQHASDHDANVLWDLREGATKFTLYTLVVGGGGVGGSTPIADPFTSVSAADCNRGIDVDPVSGDVWMSCTGKTGDTGDKDAVKVWDGASLVTIETAFSGQVRYLRRLKLVAVHEYDPGATNGHNPTTTMRLYDPATRALVRTVTVPKKLWAWTLRVWMESDGQRIAGLYTDSGTTRLRIWDGDWQQIADYQVAQKASGVTGTHAFLTVFTDADGVETLIGSAGEQLFVLGKGYAGVVPYADFEGASCGAAMKDLALMARGYVEIDHFKTGRLISRAGDDPVRSLNAVRIDVPLKRESLSLWEFYRTSAEITGAGSIREISGDTGDSAHRISLSSDLIGTGSLAQMLGVSYVTLLGQKLRQEEVSVVEPGRLLHVFDRVRMGGRLYLIVELTFHPMDRTYDLRLVEAPV